MSQLALSSTLDENQPPQWVQWINWSGHQLEKSGIHLVKLSEASLLATAQEKTGLSDWGDESFRIGLKVLLNSLNEEASLNLMGRLLMRQYITRLLVNRLSIQDTLKHYPDILDVPIQRPLIITGLPRTGTTLLQRLLARDSQFRWLHFWELMQPCPPPNQSISTKDTRIKTAQKLTRSYNTIAPAISTVHFIDAEIPEEDNPLFEHDFASIIFQLQAYIPSYGTWLRSQNMLSQYQYFREQLQLLSWHWPGRWLLKAPVHLRYLEELSSVFPDACIVQIHRDPCEVMPSICSLAAIVRSIYSDRVDLLEIGQEWLNIIEHAFKHGRSFRDQQTTTSIYDVSYRDLLNDPLKTIHGIYDFFGDRLSLEAVNGMQEWLKDNPQRKYGYHRYSLKQFGLTEAIVQDRFC